MSFPEVKKNNISSPLWLKKIVQSNKEYPVFDAVVLVYVAFTLFFQFLLQISPAVTLLTYTPLYSMQTYLGILGGVLIAVDFFTTKKIFKGKYCYLLYAICLLAALASVRMMSYGLKENIFKLCWMMIQFALVYSCAYRIDRESLKKGAQIFFVVVLTIWVICCCVSLYQYVNQIGYRYVVNPLGKDSSSTRQGFYDNRLFGIFYTLNHSAYISLFLLVVTFFTILKEKRRLVKGILCVCGFILLCHIILTNSRSAFISLILCVLVLSWFFIRRKISENIDWRKNLLVFGVSIIIAASFLLGTRVLKWGMTYVPKLNADIVCFVQREILGNEDYLFPNRFQEYDEDILNRDNLEDDQSNGRFRLWGDYLSLYKEVGPIGLSPGNYMPYIAENHEGLYIVDQTRIEYPDKYESGIIIHVHNGYLMVYVGAGILGALLLIAFIALSVKKVIATVISDKKTKNMFICAFLLIMSCAVSAVFDEGLFFQNSPQTTIFWFVLGFVLKECDVYKPSLKEKI